MTFKSKPKSKPTFLQRTATASLISVLLASMVACAEDTTSNAATAVENATQQAVEAAKTNAETVVASANQVAEKANETTTAAAQSTKPKVDFGIGKPAVEGKEYLTLKKPVATDVEAGKVLVQEFFWYRCGHCNTFEPDLEAWAAQLGDNVVFKRVPVFFGRPGMEEEQRLYYTLEAMGLLDKLHGKIFHAVHSQKTDLTNLDKMAAWVEKQGVDKAAFEKTFNSFGINSKVKTAQKLQDQYLVDGVPALAIGGKYYTSPSIAKSEVRALQVASQLIEKAKKAK